MTFKSTNSSTYLECELKKSTNGCTYLDVIHLVTGSDGAAEYYGKYIGPLKTYYHGVTGDVYAVDAKTLHIRAFTYDGEGPGE